VGVEVLLDSLRLTARLCQQQTGQLAGTAEAELHLLRLFPPKVQVWKGRIAFTVTVKVPPGAW
jgi:hypothetical protein